MPPHGPSGTCTRSSDRIQIYQSGTSWAIMSSFHSSHMAHLPFATMPLRTASMILKDFSDSTPMLDQIDHDIVTGTDGGGNRCLAAPGSESWAFPSHTSVPWDRPEIRTRSENDLGLASITICIAKSVPNSGIPKAPQLCSRRYPPA